MKSAQVFRSYSRSVTTVLIFAIFLISLFTLTTDTTFAAYARRDTTSVTPVDPIKDATVNLYCRLKAGKKTFSSSGTGVFISDRGVILTNAHVAQYFLLPEKKGRVTGRCTVRMGSPAKEQYTASVLYFPPTWAKENESELRKSAPKGTGKNDFALLYVTDAKKGTLPERFPVLPIDTTGNTAPHEAVTVTGYPTEGLDFDEIRKELALLTASSTVINTYGFQRNRPDVLTLAPSAAGSSGVSGGPVVDTHDGNVLGIVTSKSAAKDDRTLRAITLSYIDRVVQSETGLPLQALFAGDLQMRADHAEKNLSPDVIKIIRNSLLKKR